MADTLDKKELHKLAAKIVDLEGREPVIINQTIIKPEDRETTISEIEIKEDSIFVEDYYPNKENPFITYNNKLSTTTSTGIGKFSFTGITLTAVITETDKGIFEADIKVPDFINITKVDIHSKPLDNKKKKKDNFGILIGSNYGKDIKQNKNFIDLNSYVRYKKFYLGGGFNTKGDIRFGGKLEL